MIWAEPDYWHMHWSVNDDDIFALIFAEVWRTMRLTPRTPREILPASLHGSRRLGRRLPLPLPREGIGVGSPTPRTHSPRIPPHTHP